MRIIIQAISILVLACVSAALLLSQGGCEAFMLYGAMKQNEEYQTLLDVPPAYPGLEGQSVAVVVTADMSTLYQHRNMVRTIAAGVSARLSENVPDVWMIDPDQIILWQFQTPQWEAMSYGEMAEQLNVDRIVFIDMREFRLNPPGNMWLWEGVAAAQIGVIERGTIDSDNFVDAFEVVVEFPTIKGVDRNSATAQQIQHGLYYSFIEKASWLFYQHLEPKYPDKYQPPPTNERR